MVTRLMVRQPVPMLKFANLTPPADVIVRALRGW